MDLSMIFDNTATYCMRTVDQSTRILNGKKFLLVLNPHTKNNFCLSSN